MWQIGAVKKRGWKQIGAYYWQAFFLLLAVGLIGGLGSSLQTFLNVIEEGIVGGGLSRGPLEFVTGLLLDAAALSTAAGILFKIFVMNPIEVGCCRFFMESRAANCAANINSILFGFTSGSYLNVVKILFFRDLFTALWSLLFIIPGIVKGYEYAMIPYILSENPDADQADVFALTKDMMQGNKFQLFLFYLSFIGWYLLGLLACFVGALFVAPYQSAAEAEVYAALRRTAEGFPLRGFGGSGEDGELD